MSPSASLGEVVEAARRLAGAAPLLAAAGIDLEGASCVCDFFSLMFLAASEKQKKLTEKNDGKK